MKELGQELSFGTLGEEPEKKVKAPEKDKFRDQHSIVVTGKLSDELTLEDTARIHAEGSMAVRASLDKSIEDERPVGEAAEHAIDQSKKATLLNVNDYVAAQVESLRNEDETSLESMSALKVQYIIEAIDITLQEQTNQYGVIANFADRYFVYEPLYESWLKIFGDSDLELADEIFGKIAGSTTVDEFKTYFDDLIEFTLKEGALLDKSPEALAELQTIALTMGNKDVLEVMQIYALVDVLGWVPIAGQVAKSGARGLSKVAVSGARRALLKNAMEVAAKAPSKTVNEVVESGPTVATQVGRSARSIEKAEEAAVKIAGHTDDVENLGTLGPMANNPVSGKAPFHPTVQSGIEDTTAKTLTGELLEYARRALSGGLDVDAVASATRKRVEYLSGSVFNRSLHNYSFDPLTGRLNTTFGRVDNGQPLSKSQAERLAKRIPEAKVVPSSEKGKFLVEVEDVINTDDLVFNLDPASTITGMVSKTVAEAMRGMGTLSTYARDVDRLSSLAERAETGLAKVEGKILKELEKDMKKLSGKQIEDVGEVISILQSEDLVRQKSWLTEDQFIIEWAKLHGKPPSQKVIDGYHATVQASELAYMVQSTLLIGRMHNQGFRSIRITLNKTSDHYVAKKVSQIPEDVEYVWNAADGQLIKRSNIGTPRNIFKVADELEGGWGSTRYVVDTDEIHHLEPTDVLGYNAGGPRTNPTAEYFVVLFSEANEVLNVTLSASTRKQAETATRQMSLLIDAEKAGNLSDDVVKANNDWNPLIETADEFSKFVKERGIDVDKVSTTRFKMRGDTAFVSEGDTFVQGGTLDDFHLFHNKRKDKVLTHFGGERTYNDNPIKSIMSQVNTSSRKLAYTQYNQAATVSLGRKVKNILDPQGAIHKGYTDKDYLDLLDTLKAGSATPEIRRLKELKRIFELRSGAKGFGDETLERWMQNISEGIQDATKIDMRVGNPVGLANRYSFFKTFVFDPFQLILQGLHAPVIMVMAGTDGVKGAHLGWKLMGSLDLKPGKVMDEWLKKHAKSFDMSVEELREARQLFVDIARYEITSESIAESYQGAAGALRPRSKTGRATTHSVGKVWDKTRDTGMVFFNKGEQVSRTTGFGAALMKYRKQFPGESLTTPKARDWISAKEQAYTLRMSQTNRGAIQQGIGKMPTQFMSHMFRSSESVLLGKGLSIPERVKLALMLAPVYGTVGMGLSNSDSMVAALNYFLPDDSQITPGSEAEEFIRRGVYDGLMDWAFGLDTAIADRMSVLDGVRQTLRSFQEESLIEALLGAGGGGTAQTLSNLSKSAWFMMNGRSQSSQIELIEAFRQIKFIDSTTKAYYLYRHSLLKTRTGKVTRDMDVSLAETILVATGIPIQKIEDLYNTDTVRYQSIREFKETKKHFDKLVTEFWLTDDRGKKVSIAREMEAMLEYMPFTDKQKKTLTNGLWSPKGKKVDAKMIRGLIEMGLDYEARQLVATFGEED